MSRGSCAYATQATAVVVVITTSAHVQGINREKQLCTASAATSEDEKQSKEESKTSSDYPLPFFTFI